MRTARQALEIDTQGWCRQANQLPSLNFDARPSETTTNLLVIHNISLPPGQFGGGWIADLFLNRLDFDAHPYFNQLRNLRVSSHFLIRRNGELVQFVSTNDRAWHAGLSTFQGRERCNDFSIGVEMEGTDMQPFTSRQYRMLATLTISLQQHYPLTDVAGHEHIAPERKTDPGPSFDWSLYRTMLTRLDKTASASLRFPDRL